MSDIKSEWRVFLGLLLEDLDGETRIALSNYLEILDARVLASAEGRKSKPGDHQWVPCGRAVHVDISRAPPRAQTTLRKAALHVCPECGVISNRAYPYWFRTVEGEWQMAKPSCLSDGEFGSTIVEHVQIELAVAP